MKRILGIETSCDETAASVIVQDASSPFVTVESAVVASQMKLHEKYGGVFPEVASREHVRQILPVLCEALGLPVTHTGRLPDFALRGIDAIAITQGPGLIGSLLVGTQTAAAVSYATGVPLVPVNHLAGHIYASFIADPQKENQRAPHFPLMAVIVSGGHTMLIKMTGHHQYELLGQTRDDAIGEAFDKVAKLLDLGYPGGPKISKLAEKGDRHAYNFPIGLEHEDTCDFSYSGLKTAVLREVQAAPLTDQRKADIAASFERTAVEAVLVKTTKALDAFPVHDFILGGGVAANTYLRERLAALLAHRPVPVNLHIPAIEYCTDNGTVIAAAAAYGDLPAIDPKQLEARARFPLV
jgi:N6-L-threonylcarbamoyladenine synthase